MTSIQPIRRLAVCLGLAGALAPQEGDDWVFTAAEVQGLTEVRLRVSSGSGQ